jgi:hypothetical protein
MYWVATQNFKYHFRVHHLLWAMNLIAMLAVIADSRLTRRREDYWYEMYNVKSAEVNDLKSDYEDRQTYYDCRVDFCWDVFGIEGEAWLDASDREFSLYGGVYVGDGSAYGWSLRSTFPPLTDATAVVK